MQLNISQLGKRYSRKWIFKNMSFQIEPGANCAIRGRNGSGKSTLLQILSGYLSQSEGELTWVQKENELLRAELYQFVGYSAPYMDLIDAMTLEEMISHHIKFKPVIKPLDVEQICHIIHLENHKNKFLSDFSSGMKQRVKIGLAILSDVPLILLDEPGNTLDMDGKNWFHKLLMDYKKDRTIIIASNLEGDLKQCNVSVNVEEYR
jgi:ABC-type multidrug transport system ATPase subunit